LRAALFLVCLLAPVVALAPVRPATAQSEAAVAAMRAALEHVRAGDWRAADVAALPAGPAARQLVTWYRLRAGDGTLEETRAFLDRAPDWPDREGLRRAAETAIAQDTRPETVLAFFEGRVPETTAGLLRLVAAHEALNHAGDAQALAVLAWRTMPLTAEAEAALLDRHGALLAPHHDERLDALLWAGETEAARRMLPRVSEGRRALGTARLALAAQEPGVDARIDAVPAALADDPGLAWARFDWRARKGRRADAIALLLERSTGPEALGRPEAWARWRRIYARTEMQDGDPLAAYALASRHFLLAGADFAALEWLSGYLALRFLGDPELALYHFDRFAGAVGTPISLGRAGYWRGRAHAALGDASAARAAFAEGARHQTSFYGLLSAEAAGLPMDPALAGRGRFPPLAETALADSTAVEAALVLHAAGLPWRARQFLAHLGATLPRDAAGALGAHLLEIEAPNLALALAKAAAAEGRILPAAYFPLSPLIDETLPVPPDLALAIARRESEFDPAAVSPAGARGLMQVMPGTARDVSADLGISYDRDALTGDPAYNLRLGAAYLAGLIEIFGPAPVLVAVGYNAGPGRAVDWVAARGDPRSDRVDVIDWIEMIPFRETRNYVMRVAEAVMVYRARLGGGGGPVRMTDYLRRG